MAEQELAKVDYQKPLEDVPYAAVTAAKEKAHRDLGAKIAAIVGPKNVSDAVQDLDKFARDTSLEKSGRPAFVVTPENTQQISDLVKLANEMKLPMVPVSSGTHQYGAALPRMGGLILDLSSWQDIYRIDRRNRAVRVAPGVTYDQLQDALDKEGLRALIPLLPRKDQSVLTAHLEAHPMLIPEFNYSEPVYTLEIVLPTGELFRTGSAAVASPEETQTDMVGPWGPGLDWNRLFTRSQGTLGVVTWANVMAEPKPVKQKLYFTADDDLKTLVDFTARIQKKWIGYECFILNRVSLADILAKDRKEAEQLQRNLPAYVQVFCIGGLKRFPDERIAYQEADLLETSQECGVDPQPTLAGAPRAAAFFEKNLGRCWDKDVYWKDVRRGASADLFFITPMNRAENFVRAVQNQTAAAGYNFQDVGFYLQPIENGRAAHVEFSFPYQPEDAQECAQVRQLHAQASEAAYTLGALYTRAYGCWARITSDRNTGQHQTAKLIKELLDKNNIMNPGKLGL